MGWRPPGKHGNVSREWRIVSRDGDGSLLTAHCSSFSEESAHDGWLDT